MATEYIIKLATGDYVRSFSIHGWTHEVVAREVHAARFASATEALCRAFMLDLTGFEVVPVEQSQYLLPLPAPRQRRRVTAEQVRFFSVAPKSSEDEAKINEVRQYPRQPCIRKAP